MEDHSVLEQILVFLAAAVVVVPLARLLRSSAVLGYLAAGFLIGPVFGLVRYTDSVALMAEMGVVFLLFMIGLELSVERLKVLRRYVFGLGSLQVVITAAVLTVLLRQVGFTPESALVVGSGLALSSTAFVLQLLIERRELVAGFGRISFSILLLQDLAIVPMLALVPLLATPGENLYLAVGEALLKAMFAIGVTLLLGRVALKPLYRLIAAAKSPELFVATSLLVVLGAAVAMHAAGVSMALGAFLAGLLLSGSEYRHQVEADIRPFRGLLLGLFFISIGLSIDLQLVWAGLATILLATLALIAIKAVIILALCLSFRLPAAQSIRVCLYIAQGGEFGLVLVGLATELGMLPGDQGQLVIAVAVVSMAVTPLLVWISNLLGRRLEKEETAPGPEAIADLGELSDHIVICGFGRVGQTVARLLSAEGYAFVALDMDHNRVRSCRARDLPVYYGDASRLEILQTVGISEAAAAVVTLDQAESAEHAIEAIRTIAPDLPIAVRAHDLTHAHNLQQAGAGTVVPETVEASLRLAVSALEHVGASKDQIDHQLDRFRAEGYRELEETVLGGEGR